MKFIQQSNQGSGSSQFIVNEGLSAKNAVDRSKEQQKSTSVGRRKTILEKRKAQQNELNTSRINLVPTNGQGTIAAVAERHESRGRVDF